MTVTRIDRDEARRIAVRAALLDARPVEGLEHLVTAVSGIRVELTSIVMPSADHIVWSRLGDDARPGDAERALEQGRLWELIWMLRPLSQLPLHLAGMRSWPDRSGARGWLEANARFRRSILDRIADGGPVTSADVPDEAEAPWPSSGWTNDRNVTKMLEVMHGAGDLAVIGRAGRYRVWDLRENVLPPAEEVPEEEARRIRAHRLLAAFGIARDSVAIAPSELHTAERVGELVEIDGVPGRWRVDPAQLGQPFAGRTVLLSPFDRLMTDSARIERLFDFEYGIDMYKPAAKRRWGPFAIPVLHEERLIGKVDMRADRRAGTLVVAAVHEDAPFPPSVRDAVDARLAELAAWQHLRLVRG